MISNHDTDCDPDFDPDPENGPLAAVVKKWNAW